MPDETTSKNPVGRPSKYDPVYDKQAYKLTLLGATDKEIADFFGVNADTVYEWKNVYPSFSEAIRDGKIKSDAEVVSKLYDRALGAEYTEQHAFKVRNQTATGVYTESVEVVNVKKTMPPDTQAISLWLRNRRGNERPANTAIHWKDRIDNHTTGVIVNADAAASDDKMEVARTVAFLLAEAQQNKK